MRTKLPISGGFSLRLRSWPSESPCGTDIERVALTDGSDKTPPGAAASFSAMAALLRVASFALGNALLFAGFSVLWVKQYHMAPHASDAIDCVVVPWLWLVGFFAASFYSIRRPMGFTILVSLASAIAFAGILFLFI